MECGTHSPWVSRLLDALGHQVIVANPRKIPAISGSESKNDKNDAEKLARFAAYDPRLLSPVQHRSPERQQDLNLIQARSTLVRARTMVVNGLRGLVKSAGGRLPVCSTESLPVRARAAIPPALAHLQDRRQLSALRRWGLKMASSGGKRGKKRAFGAVARKLAVMLHSMWRTGQRDVAFPQAVEVAASVAKSILAITVYHPIPAKCGFASTPRTK